MFWIKYSVGLCSPLNKLSIVSKILLDGLVARGSVEACKKIVRCSGEEIVRGIVLTPREPRRATLVERDVKSNKWSGRIMC